MNDILRIARLKIALQRAFLGRAILIFTKQIVQSFFTRLIWQYLDRFRVLHIQHIQNTLRGSFQVWLYSMSTFSIPLKNTEFLNQIYPLQVEIAPFLDKNSVTE